MTIDRPIIFTAPMIRAVLDRGKCRTRRVISHFDSSTYAKDPDRVRWQPPREPAEGETREWSEKWAAYEIDSGASALPVHLARCPYGDAGTTLWVREAFRLPGYLNDRSATEIAAEVGAPEVLKVIEYLADGAAMNASGRYRAARFMPRWASRIHLTVESRPSIERLRSITDEEAMREGIVRLRGGSWGLPEWDPADLQPSPSEAFFHLFYSINEPKSKKKSNPFVWVVPFVRR